MLRNIIIIPEKMKLTDIFMADVHTGEKKRITRLGLSEQRYKLKQNWLVILSL